MTKFVVTIAIEIVIVFICVNVFEMGEGATYCFVFAAFCILLAVAVYYDDSIPKVKQNQEPQEDVWDIPSCPYCHSPFVFINENGVGYCNDCDSYWTAEEV